jgi:hypothetical protein
LGQEDQSAEIPEPSVSPILVRPVREQLEHDRVVRLLQVKLRRKFDVAVNMGADLSVPVRAGRMAVFPDLVLRSLGRTRRVAGVIEVETAESVNHLEALAQWAYFARAHVPFSLYVPAGSVDVARRLCAENGVVVDEIWSYFSLGVQVRFTLAHRTAAPRKSSARARTRSTGVRPSAGAARRKGASKAARATGVWRSGSAETAGPAKRQAKSRTPVRKMATKRSSKPARSRRR